MSTVFNDRKIKSILKDAKAGKYSLGDGLYFRVTIERSGFWVLRYTSNEKRREMTLGKYPALSLADAKAQSVLLKADIKNGADPLVQKAREADKQFKTVDDLAKDWLSVKAKRYRDIHRVEHTYDSEISPYIGNYKIEDVNPRDIRFILERIMDTGRPSISNQTLRFLKQLFRHSIKLGLRDGNPAEAFDVNDAGGSHVSRSRSLSQEELGIVFRAVAEHPRLFMRWKVLATVLLIVLGVRKQELLAAKWAEFDLDEAVWFLPQERNKTKQAITIPLPTHVVSWLTEIKISSNGRPHLFPSTSKAGEPVSESIVNQSFEKLFRLKQMPVEYFYVHDLRRTCRSILASEGVPSNIAERCLNHKIKGVEGVYDRYDYLDERRAALQKVADIVAPILNSSTVELST